MVPLREKEPFTLLDEGFEHDWGASLNPARRLYDDGRYRLRPDGSYEITTGTGLDWSGENLVKATGGAVGRSYVTNLKKGRIGNSGIAKLEVKA